MISPDYAIVYVEWVDSEHEGSWSSLEDETKHKLGTCRSVGYLIHTNDERHVIASSISETEVGNKQYVPTKIVTKMTVLVPKEGEHQTVRRRAKKSIPPPEVTK